MKKLALGIASVGIAGITGLGLAQPASAAIASSGDLTCEGYYLQVDCYLGGVTSQQVWSHNGSANPAWNGQSEIHFYCGAAGTLWTVDVTYLDGSGISQTNHLGRFCTNDAPQ